MIEFKNLHDNFLMHQAFVAAAAAAAAAAANLNASNNSTIDTLQLNLTNTSKSNEPNYASPSSSSSSIYSNCSPKRVESVSSTDDKPTPSELDKSDGSKQDEDNIYSSLPKKLKTRHHEDETSIEVDEKNEDSSECEQQSNKPKSAVDEKEELDVDVVAYKPTNTSINSAKRKLSEMEAEPNADDKEKAENKLVKEKKSIMSSSSSSSSSSLSSPSSSSSTSSIHTSSSNSMCSPQQQNSSINKQSISSSQKPSFLISDILGISSKPASSSTSTFSPSSSTSSLSSTSSATFPALASFLNPASFLSNNERLIQQYQLSLQRAFPYLTGLNPADFYKFIASTMSMEALNSSFSAESSNFQFPAANNLYSFNKLNTPNPLSPSMSSNRPAVVPNLNNYKAHASTPILNNSPSKQQQQIPLQKLQQSPISNQVQAQPKKPAVQSANFILSSLEQLTKNQFKDYPSPKISSLSKKTEPSILSSTVSSLKSEKITDNNDKKKVEDKQAKDSSKSGDAGKANNGNLFPAWVYCTRYSDRPSAGNYFKCN